MPSRLGDRSLTRVARRGVAAFAGSVALTAAGCGGGEEARSPAPPRADGAAREPDDRAPDARELAKPASPGEAVELYFTAGEQFSRVERELPASGSPVEAATEALVEGPTKRERGSAADVRTLIPAGVEVQSVNVSEAGIATVEVSEEFLRGVPARPAARSRAQEQELAARLGQVTYTLTQFPRVEATRVVAGGVGVEPALDRDDYARPDRPPSEPERPRGSASADTRAIQERLAKLRYLPERAVDGVFGYRTEQAVVAFQAWEGLERDGIVGPITRAALADARRPRPSGSGDRKRVEVFRGKGVALLVVEGRVKRAVHVSTGASGTETPAGAFEVFRKERMSWSYPFQQWLPWASYFNQGIAFHEYASVPPYPASHGCVRVPAPEARYVYRFAEIGIKVRVY